MTVRKTPVHKARVFTVQPGAVAGTVRAQVPSAGRRAAYDWQYTTDGGKTWLALPTTMQSRTSLSGLQPGTYAVRFRVVTKTGAGNWSAPVAIILH
jgi:hypothetical protein